MPTAATFFSGIGGACHGLKLAGYDVIFGNDSWDFVEPIWRSLNPDAQFYLGDFLKLKAKDVPETDLFWFSPPCQNFSLANPKRGQQLEQALEFSQQIFYLAKVRRPSTVAIENVPLYAKSQVFHQLLYSFMTIGYYPRFKIVDAANFGVPQHRKRMILIFTLVKPVVQIGGETDRLISWNGFLSDSLPVLTDRALLIFQQKTRRKLGQPAPTVTGGVCRSRAYVSVDGSDKNLFRLSNKHLAKLQTLPDFDWGENQKFSVAIGNAVPSNLVKNLVF